MYTYQPTSSRKPTRSMALVSSENNFLTPAGLLFKQPGPFFKFLKERDRKEGLKFVLIFFENLKRKRQSKPTWSGEQKYLLVQSKYPPVLVLWSLMCFVSLSIRSIITYQNLKTYLCYQNALQILNLTVLKYASTFGTRKAWGWMEGKREKNWADLMSSNRPTAVKVSTSSSVKKDGGIH